MSAMHISEIEQVTTFKFEIWFKLNYLVSSDVIVMTSHGNRKILQPYVHSLLIIVNRICF